MSETKKRLVATVKRTKNAIGVWALRNELVSSCILILILGLIIGGITSVLDFFLVA